MWRSIALPVRLIAPVFFILRRVLTGKLWSETVEHSGAKGPRVRLRGQARDLQRPQEGVGPLNHRTYHVRIAGSQLAPADLMEAFRTSPNRFSPTSYAVFAPDPAPEGLRNGDRLTVVLPGPWNGPIQVAAVSPDRIRLETLDGHLEAGWIEFSVRSSGADVEFRIESYARSGDSVVDLLYHRVGIAKLFQTETWVQVLESAVRVSRGEQRGRIMTSTTVYEGADQ